MTKSIVCTTHATQLMASLVVIPIQNLNPDVLMMKSAEDWNRCDAAYLLDPAKIRRIFLR